MWSRQIYEFVLEMGAKVDANCTTIATGIVYLYRFLKVSPPEFRDEQHTVAAVCLYLAGKVEEDFIRIRDIINVAHRILHPEKPLLDIDKDYWTIREGMGKLEMVVLRNLGFQLQHNHPHKYLLHYMKTLEGWIERDVLTSCPCVKTAWSILSDCYADPDFILQNKPQLIAVTIIYISLTIYGIQIPYAESSDPNPWWTILSGTDTESLLSTANKILDIIRTKREVR